MKLYGRHQARKFSKKLQGTFLTHCLNSPCDILTPCRYHFAAGKSKAGNTGGERGLLRP